MTSLTRALPLALFAAFAAPAGASADAPCVIEPGAYCADGKAVTREALIERLRRADVVVIGERHDNPDHHARQADLTAAVAPEGLAFEMIKQADERKANAAREADVNMRETLRWDTSGWPDWEMYAPIFEAAPEAKLAGGGAEREALMGAIRHDAATAFGAEAARFGLDRPLDEETQVAMEEEQMVAHCGALPEQMAKGMVEAQRLRDAAFAAAALRLIEEGRKPVVLIVGNGHARTDRGAPLYLKAAAPDLDIVSIGQLEIDNTPEGVPFDYVVHTPAHDRGDPCAELLKRHGKSGD